MSLPGPKPLVAIACGGTGGHLFPGLAVARELQTADCDVLLLVSPKEVDRQALNGLSGLSVATLPTVGFTRGRRLQFVRGSISSYRICRARFRERPPRAVLSMGGFTSVGPILAGRRGGAATFLHESNAMPGRANRWLARVATQVFVGFEEAARRLPAGRTLRTGTPVRAEFVPQEAGVCRERLGLDRFAPLLLVVGGSQGAHAINQLVSDALPELRRELPELQYLHLTGSTDETSVRAVYERHGARCVVRSFLAEMPAALAAATVAVSRAGASSLAEFAAMRTPAILIPYPAAADNHQFHNAMALASTGAAQLLEQRDAAPEPFVRLVAGLIRDPESRRRLADATAPWHAPDAAARIAGAIVQSTAHRTGVLRPTVRSQQGGAAGLPHPPMRSPATMPR